LPWTIGEAVADDEDRGTHDRNLDRERGASIPGFSLSSAYGNSQTD
jgi:hypothetical protein